MARSRGASSAATRRRSDPVRARAGGLRERRLAKRHTRADGRAPMYGLTLHDAALVGARFALAAAALTVVACCLHVKRRHPGPVRTVEVAWWALVMAAAVVASALVADLAMAALGQLALLGGVVVRTRRTAIRG